MGEASSDVAAQASAVMRVLAVSRVAPSSALGEGQPAGSRLKLSLFDTPWVVLPPIQRVFLYDLGEDGGDDDRFAAAVDRLKRALADTLAHYLPLAGRLEYVAETEEVSVDCSDAGVAFVEAQGDIDVRRIAGDEEHDIPAFLGLVPELDARVLPAPVLSVQATRLRAGLAVGLSVHHAVADGRAVWRFIEAWASASREGSPVTKALGPPHYGREAVAQPSDDELGRDILKTVAPNLPAVRGDYDFSQRFLRARRTFYLGTDDIKSLRRRIDDLASAEAGSGDDAPSQPKPKPVSTFVALAALSWTAFVRSKGLGAGDDTYLMFLADLRTRLDPPVSEAYFGNCVRACMATCTDASELLGEAGILRAARAVQAAVAAMEAAPMAGTDKGWIHRLMRLPFHRMTNVAASPRFRAYDVADFGFGKPARVELVSMNHDGEMILVGGRNDGEVQASVSIDPAHMDVFKACILA
uniref:Uncharacterized protein n=1 Tax=Avena sativa TaxID=4498 RepID=A0ACD6AFP1_AVESA